MKWFFLLCAVGVEVPASLSLRAGVDNPWLYLVAIVGYPLSFYFLGLVLKSGTPIGVAYGIWGALGVMLTACGGAVLWAEPLTLPIVLGLVLLIAGVLLIEFGSQAALKKRAAETVRDAGRINDIHGT